MRFRSKGQPTQFATLVDSFFDLLSMEKKFNFWGIYIIETLSGLFSLIFLIALIVAIVYGVKWWKNRKDEAKSVNTDLKLSEITGLKMYFFTGLNAALHVVPCNLSYDMICQKF